jgi:hypothetical protein
MAAVLTVTAETKGKSLEEIEIEFRQRASAKASS